jgi:hypothetical protein
MEADHSGTPVDQSGNAHAVVEWARLGGYVVDATIGCLRRTLSAAVTPATPLPRTTTRLTAESNAKIKVFEASLAARSGLDSIVTGPWTFAQHAMRVEAANPRIRSRKTASLPHVRHTNSRASDHTSPRNTQIDQWFASLSSVAASVGDAYQ